MGAFVTAIHTHYITSGHVFRPGHVCGLSGVSKPTELTGHVEGKRMCVLDGGLTMQDWMIWDRHPVRRTYDIVMDLGEGAFSSVVLARHKTTKKLVALKVVYLLNPDTDDEHLAVTRREAEFLNMLDSPRIVECYDVIDDNRQLVMVLEYLRGGQLYDSLHRLGGALELYTEQAAAGIFSQMAEGVAFLHSYSIIHRDIKGENFVFTEDPAHAAAKGRSPTIKLIDLGMSVLYDPKNPSMGALGSPGFVSPEAVNDEAHTPAMDIFSLGVVAFIMLVGRKPFSVQQSESLEYCDMDIKDAPGLLDPRWMALSASSKDLVMGMMTYNASRRLTAQQVMKHEWVASRGGAVRRPLGAEVVHGAANVASIRRLRNLAHGVIAFNRLSTNMSVRDPMKRNAAEFASSRAKIGEMKGYRNDSSGRGITRGDRHVLETTGANAARLHDKGLTSDPSEDISVYFRPNRSVHGGNAFSGDEGSRRGLRRRLYNGSKEDLREKSLKKASSAVVLSELELEGSYHGGLNGSSSVANLQSVRRASGGGGLARLSSFLSGRRQSKESLLTSSDEDRSGSRKGAARRSDQPDASFSSPLRFPRDRGGPPPADSSGHGQCEFGEGSRRGTLGTKVRRVSPLQEGRESLEILNMSREPVPPTTLQQYQP